MRKILAFLVLLMLPWVARGQALADWYYWFDTDKAPRESGKMSGQNIQLQVDVSQLEIGAHTLFVQVVDTAGVYSPPVGSFFFHVPDVSRISKLFYSLGGETESRSVDFGNGRFSLDVSSCPTGINSINLQVMDKQGSVSGVMPYLFYKVPPSTKLSRFRYWFDSNAAVNEQAYGQGHYLIDVTKLNPGFHFINYYVMDEEGTMTDIESSGFYRMPMFSNQKLNYWFAGDTIATQVPDYKEGFTVDVSKQLEGFNTIYFQMEDNGPTDIETCHFIKVPQTENAGDMTLVCIIDGKIVGEEKVAAHGGIVKCDMDVSNMEVGLHKAMFQLITPSGSGSSIAETYFIRTLTNDDIASMQCSYTIDGFYHRVQKGSCTNGAFHFDLLVDEVEDGLHRIDYMLVAENGATTTSGSAWFFKTPVGGNGITQYDYWLNNKSNEVQRVTLAEPKDPFQLIKLLPVTTEPIRSSCFHFENKNNQPKIYAKNDIHFRFHDRSGRWVDADNQYVDNKVSEDVVVTKQLTEVFGKETFETPDSNAIRWYSMECAKGDSIAVQSSQATSVQIFAPSGDEVFNVSGSESVKLGGTHAPMDGTYYFAIHDVTGSKPEMTLNYQHIDKYAILDYDVHTVGNGGCSTITFNGNGFKDLYAVDLVCGNDTIKHFDIGHEHDANTSVTFDFNGAATGQYDAIFHFTLEDRFIKNAVKVEEAKDIELATVVSYPSTFLRGTSTTYTIKITNNGNMTAYCVPIYAWLKSKAKKGYYNISIKGLNIPKLPDYVEQGELSSDEYEQVKSDLSKYDDDHNFLKFSSVDPDNPNDSIIIRTNYFFTNIAPNETRVVTFTLSTTESNVYAYFTIPDEWHTYSLETENGVFSARAKFRSPEAESWYCCYHERIECIANITANGLDIASLFSVPGPTAVNIASCVAGIVNQTLSAAGDAFCGKNDVQSDFVKKVNNIAKGISITGALASCASAFGVKNASELTIGLDAILHPKTNIDCITAFFQQKPNCPPKPPKGGPSTPAAPVDPNDIYGFLANSGSKFVNDTIVTVPYRIEFENDTTFATASAHTVIVKDTLDASKFDLSSYQPTSIKIGDKDVQLSGDKEFVTTIDMRPAIYAIAQVEGMYDEKAGIATWKFTSLDPMSMEETNDVMQGFLPINYDGNGIGEVAYNINLKSGIEDGAEINNQASIVFDSNDAIMTPTWTNVMDAVPPTSSITSLVMQNDSIFDISFSGEDNRSGIWKYTLYVQAGLEAPWWEVATDIAPDSIYTYKGFDCIDYGFCVLATDSAGNVEKKELVAEVRKMATLLGDANADGEVNVIDLNSTVNYIMERPSARFNAVAADVNKNGKVNVADLNGIVNIIMSEETNESRSVQKARAKAAAQEATESLYSEDVDVAPGDTIAFGVYLDNAHDASSIQFDLMLPEGVSVVPFGSGYDVALTNRAQSSHSVFGSYKKSGAFRVVAYSTNNQNFAGSTGRLVTIKLKVDDQMAEGTYDALLNNIILATSEEEGLNAAGGRSAVNVSGTTSIRVIKNADDDDEGYTLQGVKRQKKQKGVKVTKDKKEIIK